MSTASVVLVCGCALMTWCATMALLGVRLLPRKKKATSAFERVKARFEELPAVKQAKHTEEVDRRRTACLDELPVMLDVVTLGLSAGLSFDASLSLYCERCSTELAQAFSEAMLSWQMGVKSREQALMDMADELGVTALKRFATVVCESLTFGTPMAEALERQAQSIRDEQRSQVEEEIEKVPVKMLIPLGVLIVPAMFLAILGPLLGPTLVGA